MAQLKTERGCPGFAAFALCLLLGRQQVDRQTDTHRAEYAAHHRLKTSTLTS